jgi:hypothetical protein
MGDLARVIMRRLARAIMDADRPMAPTKRSAPLALYVIYTHLIQMPTSCMEARPAQQTLLARCGVYIQAMDKVHLVVYLQASSYHQVKSLAS